MGQARENCFFYVDESKSPEDRTMCVMCVACHDKDPEVGWFWEGSRLGYGPFDFVCDRCGNVIHQLQKGEANEAK